MRCCQRCSASSSLDKIQSATMITQNCLATRTVCRSSSFTPPVIPLQHASCHARPQGSTATASQVGLRAAESVGLAQRRGRCVATATARPRVFAGAPDDDSMVVELKIEGMVCGGCSSRVEEVIKKMNGVRKVSVDLDKKLAQIEVTAASQMDAVAALPTLVQAVKDLGFEAEPHFA